MHNQHKILRVLRLITFLKTRPAKSIRHIGNLLDSSERTVYRYLDLLGELGFQINKDNGNRVFIDGNNNENKSLESSFTSDELNLIRDLLLTVGKQNKIHESILKKFYINSDLEIASNLLLRAHLGKIVQDAGIAIHEKKQVVLKKYHSANSKDVRDRLIEPIKFTDNYQSLVAYEISSGKNKYFNIERITSIQIKPTRFKNESKHKFSSPDVFGFSENGKTYSINLMLSLRAYVFLKEEYPMTIPFITKDKKTDKFNFKGVVNDLKPVTRFVLGLLDEIEIVGSPEFKKHLKEHINKIVGNK